MPYSTLKPHWSTTEDVLQKHFNRWFPVWAMLLVLSMIPGLFTPIMEPDGALYASIAKEMYLRNDWVNLYAKGADWLDKPHLPFWITALSFNVFGVSAFAYKLPAFLFWLIGARYTYLLAKHFYGKPIAQAATIIYLSALHAILSNNDVRAEPYLTCFLIAASYHLIRMQNAEKWKHLFPAALFSALGLMTKGPFVMIPLAAGLLGHWIFLHLRKEGKPFWRRLLEPQWYVYLVLTVLLTTPELYCLYVQFDQHPEKIVFGRTHVSGLRFFWWDSQFGRFLNTGPIKGKGDPAFFIHTTLWAFLPWSIYLFIAWWKGLRIKHHQPSENQNMQEKFTLWAALFTLLIFSLSRFQLPHYLNMLFPYFSITVAHWMLINWSSSIKPIRWMHGSMAIISLLLLILPTLVTFLFKPVNWWLHPILMAAFLIPWWLLLKHKNPWSWLRMGALGALGLSVFLNQFFYPALLPYQGGKRVAEFMNEQLPEEKAHVWAVESHAFHFYSQQTPVYLDSFSLLNNPQVQKDLAGKWLYTGKWGKEQLDLLKKPVQKDQLLQANPQANLKSGPQANPEASSEAIAIPEAFRQPILEAGKNEYVFPTYRITRLTGKFLNPKTRSSQMDTIFLIKMPDFPLVADSTEK